MYGQCAARIRYDPRTLTIVRGLFDYQKHLACSQSPWTASPLRRILASSERLIAETDRNMLTKVYRLYRVGHVKNQIEKLDKQVARAHQKFSVRLRATYTKSIIVNTFSNLDSRYHKDKEQCAFTEDCLRPWGWAPPLFSSSAGCQMRSWVRTPSINYFDYRGACFKRRICTVPNTHNNTAIQDGHKGVQAWVDPYAGTFSEDPNRTNGRRCQFEHSEIRLAPCRFCPFRHETAKPDLSMGRSFVGLHGRIT